MRGDVRPIFYDRFCTGCKNARRVLERITRNFTTINVRKTPVLKKDLLPLVRRFKKAGVKAGPVVKEIDIATADDDTLLLMFLSRDGEKMRAPVLAYGHTIFAGSDDSYYRSMLRR